MYFCTTQSQVEINYKNDTYAFWLIFALEYMHKKFDNTYYKCMRLWLLTILKFTVGEMTEIMSHFTDLIAVADLLRGGGGGQNPPPLMGQHSISRDPTSPGPCSSPM